MHRRRTGDAGVQREHRVERFGIARLADFLRGKGEDHSERQPDQSGDTSNSVQSVSFMALSLSVLRRWSRQARSSPSPGR